MKRVTMRILLSVLMTLAAIPVLAQNQKKYTKDVEVAAIPIISYNKSFGGIFGGMGTLFFPLISSDTLSPASLAGGGGVYTTNNTWFLFGFAKFYYDEDNFRSIVAAGKGTMNFQYYNDVINSGMYIDYSSDIQFLVFEQLVRFYDRFYTGLDFITYKVQTSFEQGPGDTSQRRYVALGIPISYDSRDNVVTPSRGWFSNARFNRFDSAFGSASEYTKLDMDVSNYRGPDTSHVLASKATFSTGLGSVPFEAKTIVGSRILRGYSQGKYRGDQVYGLQAEYRWGFSGPWGAVFFGGVATPVNAGESWSASDLLPAAGAGLRFMLVPSLRVNVGIDAAVGRGDYGVYFRIGEAF